MDSFGVMVRLRVTVHVRVGIRVYVKPFLVLFRCKTIKTKSKVARDNFWTSELVKAQQYNYMYSG